MGLDDNFEMISVNAAELPHCSCSNEELHHNVYADQILLHKQKSHITNFSNNIIYRYRVRN